MNTVARKTARTAIYEGGRVTISFCYQKVPCLYCTNPYERYSMVTINRLLTRRQELSSRSMDHCGVMEPYWLANKVQLHVRLKITISHVCSSNILAGGFMAVQYYFLSSSSTVLLYATDNKSSECGLRKANQGRFK